MRPRTTIVPLALAPMRVVAAVTTALLTAALVSAAAPSKKVPSSRAVFERRILPILNANNPSTCAECHLSGVDLKAYIRPSEAQTFASLRDAGLVDLKRPEESHILRFIRMSSPKSTLVNQKVRAVEYEAFRDWIVAASKDPKMVSLRRLPAGKQTGPKVSNAVIRHTRIDAVVASFERNIWSQQGRCMNCHEAGTPGNDKNVEKFGPRVAWFKRNSPEETMHALIDQGDMDVDHPEQSLILLKPLGKVQHGGGVKMLYGDAGYKMFRAWVEDYAASVKGMYRTPGDLPALATTRLVEMNCITAVSGGPIAWKGRSLRADVYPWDSEKNAWADRPAATGERIMSADQTGTSTGTNLIMYLIAPATSTPADSDRLLSRLGQGRYLLKYYVDTAGALDKDYTMPTDSPGFFQGAQEVRAVWNARAGWGALVRVGIALPADAAVK